MNIHSRWRLWRARSSSRTSTSAIRRAPMSASLMVGRLGCLFASRSCCSHQAALRVLVPSSCAHAIPVLRPAVPAQVPIVPCLWCFRFRVCSGLSLRVPAHTSLALVGPSGCGKSRFDPCSPFVLSPVWLHVECVSGSVSRVASFQLVFLPTCLTDNTSASSSQPCGSVCLPSQRHGARSAILRRQQRERPLLVRFHSDLTRDHSDACCGSIGRFASWPVRLDVVATLRFDLLPRFDRPSAKPCVSVDARLIACAQGRHLHRRAGAAVAGSAAVPFQGLPTLLLSFCVSRTLVCCWVSVPGCSALCVVATAARFFRVLAALVCRFARQSPHQSVLTQKPCRAAFWPPDRRGDAGDVALRRHGV